MNYCPRLAYVIACQVMTATTGVGPRNADAAIGERIHQLMWRSRVSQVELARQIGITQPGLSKKLRGERPWYVGELIEAAKLLGTSVSWLFGEASPPDPQVPGGEMVRRQGLEPRTRWLSATDSTPPAPPTVLEELRPAA